MARRRGTNRLSWALAGMFGLTVACGDDAVPGQSSSGSTTMSETATAATAASDTEIGDTDEPPANGQSNGAFVNAGHHAMTSQSHRLLFTFGQSSMNQGTMTSPNYRLVGGLVPATQ